MSERLRALRHEAPRRLDVPGVALAALAMLAFGVTVPALTFDNLFGDETFSVLSGIQGFVTSGNLLLALLLSVFSVLFPALKLLTVLMLWLVPLPAATRRDAVGWLEVLGKWSLLDAFVIAVLIGTVQLGVLSAAAAEPGVYLYLGAIVLSLVATALLRPLVRDGHDEATRRPLRRRGLLLTLPAAVCYGLGLSLPLLEVEKAWLWGNRFSLLDGITQLYDDGELGLAAALSAFVVALPTLRFAMLLALRLLRSDAPRAVSWLRVLDRWSMAEVFVLALLVVFTKLDALASPTPRAGMWLLLASGALTAADSLLLERTAGERRPG